MTDGRAKSSPMSHLFQKKITKRRYSCQQPFLQEDPNIDETKCIHCGKCADICPLSVFFFRREERAVPEVRYPDECWHCNACGLDCPQGAVSLQITLNYILLRIESSKLNQTKD